MDSDSEVEVLAQLHDLLHEAEAKPKPETLPPVHGRCLEGNPFAWIAGPCCAIQLVIGTCGATAMLWDHCPCPWLLCAHGRKSVDIDAEVCDNSLA